MPVPHARKKKRGCDLLLSQRESNNLPVKLFSFCKSKDLYTDNRFQAYTGVSNHNRLLSQLSLMLFGSRKCVFFLVQTCFGLTAGMK